MKWLFFSAVICPLFFALPAEAVATNTLLDGCFIQAGKRYQIAPDLLKTIAQQESSLVATAINHNKNKSGKIISTDYGIMQINSVHIPELKKLGVIKDKNDLLNNPCLNIETGAWILARHFQRCGVNWECLGSYNAGFSKNNTARRMIYARKIHNRYFRQY
ncbi:lytic transglycosylase domain-containing protein [Escherichia coli]|uniref:lytic transglycosylase domain-containing protein n=4 Tax=Escherichia coli TaxID=562 RepID=UPI00081C1AFE|nr:lytic transglycosylase domain-containing protein [Escherichia coli]HBN3440142.1 lytic transglycosylase domain-containing protein [Escherichia coli O25b:H4-ST131]ASX09209.1 lytic transglycosylase [Escherichia coli]EFE7110443.1 transglycosylase SLT domain-containing protein [Escherichia coli]EFN5145359.1 lytic transglycosylase domain-containing protein [Escherichia coli]EFN5809165.1 lytic transglycosylase domain-containing protein [Escherichia coli]